MKKSKTWSPDLNTFADALNGLILPAREPGERAMDLRPKRVSEYLASGPETVFKRCTEDLGEGMGVMLEVEVLAAALSAYVSPRAMVVDLQVSHFCHALRVLDGSELWRRILACLAAADADERFRGCIFGGAPAVEKPATSSKPSLSDGSLFDPLPNGSDEDDEDGLDDQEVE
jgi:hypothetical protein